MSRFWITTFALVWIFAIGMGLRSMASYENTPGTAAHPAAKFPQSDLMQRRSDKPLLLMFAHPRCPCTRASLAELAQVALHCADKAEIMILFFVPKKAMPDWFQTELWQKAADIPGVVVMQDKNGAEAKRFHAETSGETILYDAQGKLLFHGGITAQRGHEGSNIGRIAIESLLNHQNSATNQTLVFGCSLHRDVFTTQGETKQCRQ